MDPYFFFVSYTIYANRFRYDMVHVLVEPLILTDFQRSTSLEINITTLHNPLYHYIVMVHMRLHNSDFETRMWGLHPWVCYSNS